jgi:hypothetical protein
LDQLERARRRDAEGKDSNNQGASISRIKDLTLLYSFDIEDATELKECMRRVGETGDIECSICLDDVTEVEEEAGTVAKIRLLPCSHIFHEACIRTWLQQKKLCPLCKLDIAETFRWYKHGSPEGMNESDTEQKNEMYEKSKRRFQMFRQALKEFSESDEESGDEETEEANDNNVVMDEELVLEPVERDPPPSTMPSTPSTVIVPT